MFLINELECTPIQIDKNLAVKIGLKESILLQVINNYLDKDHNYIFSNKVADLFPFLEKKAINSKINKLIKLGYLTLVELSKEEKKEMLINKNLKGTGIGDYICEWCGCNTLLLHEHHYPIPRKLFGVSTVKICGTCHYEYHYLDNIRVIKKVAQ